MGTNRGPLEADLFLSFYERHFMLSLSRDKDAEVIAAINSTSRYLDDLLNVTISILMVWSIKLPIRTSAKKSKFI